MQLVPQDAAVDLMTLRLARRWSIFPLALRCLELVVPLPLRVELVPAEAKQPAKCPFQAQMVPVMPTVATLCSQVEQPLKAPLDHFGWLLLTVSETAADLCRLLLA